MSDAIDVVKYAATFHVETPHQDNLEFVLGKAGERNQRDYPGLLWAMMNKNLGHAHIEGGEVVEQTIYGTVCYTLEVCKVSDLQRALTICADTVKAWMWRYRVQGMAL